MQAITALQIQRPRTECQYGIGTSEGGVSVENTENTQAMTNVARYRSVVLDDAYERSIASLFLDIVSNSLIIMAGEVSNVTMNTLSCRLLGSDEFNCIIRRYV